MLGKALVNNEGDALVAVSGGSRGGLIDGVVLVVWVVTVKCKGLGREGADFGET